jgi:23S rRNA (uridine2552-2'-O)-methyltransferase
MVGSNCYTSSRCFWRSFLHLVISRATYTRCSFGRSKMLFSSITATGKNRFSSLIPNPRNPSLPRICSPRFKSSKSKSSTQWLSRQGRDPFVKQRSLLDESGSFRARSAFKLVELDDQFRFLNAKGVRTVVDLGAAPGGWSQVAARRMGLTRRYEAKEHPKEPSGDSESDKVDEAAIPSPIRRSRKRIIAVDLLPITPIPGVDTIQGDFLDASTHQAIENLLDTSTSPRVDVILSDMAPNMSGNRSSDIGRSIELCGSVFEFAQTWLTTSVEAGHSRGGTLV